jgi:filamentous hemagglutinin family protein
VVDSRVAVVLTGIRDEMGIVRFGLLLGIGMGGALWATSAIAQITPDGTLGTQSSVVTDNVDIKGVNSTLIDGGATRGSNLFHSFEQFNIGENGGAYFSNPIGIENIISRVTGTNPSNINGTLGVLGSANLFFINPNGIIFGSNARLDVGGSFVGSTANAVKFGEDGFFSATSPESPSDLLRINPSALFFNQLQARRIENRSIALAGSLQVPDDRSLLLAGEEITVDGGRLNASGGRVELAGVADNGTIGLNVDGNNLSLSVPDGIARGNVSLTNGARVDVRAGGGGFITVNAGNLEIKERSVLLAGIRFEQGEFGDQAGNIELNARERVSLDRSFVFNDLERGAIGKGGNIKIFTDQLFATNGAAVAASTFGQGDGGSVIINAKDTASFDGPSIAFSTVERGGNGNSGNIEIITNSLFVTNGAQISASTLGEGNAGSVIINAKNTFVDGEDRDGFRSGIFSQVRENAIGQGGDISVNTVAIKITNGALLVANTRGKGDGGSIKINATDSVSFDGTSSNGSPSTATSRVVERGVGKGGSIEIITGSLSVTNGAQLVVNTRGQGDAGSIKINATDTVSFDGRSSDGELVSAAFSSVGNTGVGNGGGIDIATGNLDVTNGARLEASSFGKGDAGNVIINATDSVSFDGSDAFTAVFNNAIGKGGNIEISATSVSVSNNSRLIAGTDGQGDAGNVIINGIDFVSFDNSGVLSSVDEKGKGNGGSIKITTDSLSIANGAQLSASTRGKGDAGSVIINAEATVSFDGDMSVAFTNVEENGVGKGGNIEITTGSLFVTNSAQLNAWTAGKGDAGSIIIKAKDTVSFDGVSQKAPTFRSAAFSQVRENATGKGGNVEITTDSLFVTNGAQLQASTDGKGDAGNVIIKANNTVVFDGVSSNGKSFSRAFSEVRENATGKGGSIEITTNALSLTNGAQLSARTLGEGKAGNIIITADTFEATNGGQLLTATSSNFDAGNITLKVQDNITLSGLGTGIFANTTEDSTGIGGNIFIDPQTVTIRDGAKIAVDSQGTGIGGDVELKAGFLTLDNGQITAQTRSNTGGNITLNLQDLLSLRNRSQISTTAGNEQFGGDGGNITITAPNGFVIAIPNENSDITANAFSGAGGRVNIDAQGIFGIASRNRETPLSDITASSELGIPGVVQTNTPNTDFSLGLVELPKVLADTSDLVDTGCAAFAGDEESEFIVTGRGGLPPNPYDPLSTDVTWTDTRVPKTTPQQRALHSTKPQSQRAKITIAPTTGWVFKDNGEVTLISHAQSAQVGSPTCRQQ